MKFKVLIFTCLFFVMMSCNKDKSNVNGYPEDVLSKEVYNKVQSSYDSIGSFEKGSAIVKSQRLYGIIDENGKLILPCDYEEISSLIDSLDVRFVKNNSKWGLIDNDGNIKIKCHYDSFNDPVDLNYIPFELNGKWGIVDIEDKIKVQFKYDKIHTSKNFFVAQLRGSWGIETFDNKLVLDYIYDDMAWYLVGDHSAWVKKGEKYGLVNKDGKLIAECEYDKEPYECNGYIVMKRKGRYGLLNANNGESVIPFEYDYLDDYYDGFIAAAKDNKHGYLNIKNQIVIPFVYDDAYRFSEGLACVGKITGYMNTYGGLKPVIKYGFINKSGEIVIQYQYKEQIGMYECYFSEGLCPYGVYIGPGGHLYANTYGYINRNGEIAIKAQFDRVKEFINGVAVVEKDDKYGLINKTGEIVVPCEYDYIGYYEKTDSIIELKNSDYKTIAFYDIKKKVIRK